MIGKLIDTIRRLSSYRDTGSYTGAFSYAAEWHAAAHGLYDGLTETTPWNHRMPENPDTEKEPHYYKGSYLFGVLGRYALLAIVGYSVL